MSFGLPGIENGAQIARQECRPDPEKLLQQARERKLNYEKALSLLRELNSLQVSYGGGLGDNKGEVILSMIGAFNVRVWDEDNRIELLLKEINKG